MTNEGSPEDRPKRQFMTRRERREYERAQQQAQRASEVQQAANTGHRSGEDIPYLLPADGAGGFETTPQRPIYTGADGHTDYSRYDTDQNIDLGDLSPLPEDTRDYPDLAEDVAEQLDEEIAEEESDEHPLGYMLVADGSQPAPKIDEEALKIRKSRKRRRTVVMLSSFAVFLALLIGVGLGVSHFVSWTKHDYPGPGGDEVQFEVLPGDGAIVIGNRLVEQDIVASTGAFRDAIEASDGTSEIQPGEYTLRYEMPARDAASILLREDEEGKNYAYVNSGYRIDDVYDTIAEQTSYSVKEIEEAADPSNFGLPDEASSLEGYIAVGEYHFPIDASLQEILEQMIEPTMQEFDRLGIEDPKKQFRVVTIASILQAEARTKDFPEVAGIIENRLDPANPETSGYLQIDATVIYGMGVRQLQFSAEDREDKSNPYNTYVHRGLPPGPIGAPSIEALDAAAEPKSSDNYYWITTNIETGETKFSSTYEQHQKYQREYREYCDDNPDLCGRGE
ncbi:MAG TPA: endolytic transglycosylase MltG [Candidatus Yaniella excrementigallinarum]|nr:endolytic transglycosylase MltG [Candidatus Yaniella excrementigallinarum]